MGGSRSFFFFESGVAGWGHSILPIIFYTTQFRNGDFNAYNDPKMTFSSEIFQPLQKAALQFCNPSLYVKPRVSLHSKQFF